MDDQLTDLRARIDSIVRKVCPASFGDHVDDLVQAATLKVWDKVGGEGNNPLSSSYLWKVAHSVLIDEIRRVRRRKEVDFDGAEPMLEGSRVENPEISADSLETGQAIRACLANLVEARRRAVTAYLLGHTVPDTARLLRWNLKKTESLVYRGLKQLRECLKSKGVTP